MDRKRIKAHSTKERWTRRQVLGASAGTAGLILLASCTPTGTAPVPVSPAAGTPAPAAPTPAVGRGGKVAFADVRMPPTMDIQATVDDFADVIGQQIYQPLVYLDPKSGSPAAGLAESWEVSGDGRTWTFKLRRGVKFQDGTPFDAAAVKKSWGRLLDPATKSPRAALLGGTNLVGVEAADASTVVVRHKEPMANFLANIARTAAMIISPAAIDRFGEKLSENAVGTGPFKLGEYVQANRVVLQRWDDFNWAPGFFGRQGAAFLDEFTFRHITEEGTRVAAVERGELQIGRIPWSQWERFKGLSGFTAVGVSNPGVPGGMYINANATPLNDVRVRRAIAHALNRDPMLKAPFLGPAVWLELGPLTTDVWGYDPAVERIWPAYDPAKAKQLLVDAGYQPGADGIAAKAGQRLQLRLVAGPGSLPFSQVIQAQLREVGIGVEIIQADAPASRARWDQGNDHLLPSAHTGNDPDLLWDVYHTGGLAFTKDTKVDQLLERGRVTTNADQRKGVYGELQRHIAEQVYSLHVYNSARTYAVKEGVEGITFNERAGIYAYNISIK